jgi:hypothetical protein
MGSFRRFFRFFTKDLIKGYIEAMTGPAIEDGPVRDRNGQHFFQANGLGAKLDQIAVVGLWFAPFILHREWLPCVLIQAMEFYHISLPHQAEPQRTQGNAVFDPNLSPGFAVLLMNLLVHDPTFRCHEIFIPDLLYMDQGALALTKDIVLKGREHDEIVL